MSEAQVAHIMALVDRCALDMAHVFRADGATVRERIVEKDASRAAVEAELRRLDAREAELLALLRQANERLIDNRDDVARTESARYMSICYDPLIVAIKAATGEEP